jgi:hypothetical protein
MCIQLQLALRHRGNWGVSVIITRAFALALQTAVAPEGPLAELAQRGWEDTP